jgi:hypothetical protein
MLRCFVCSSHVSAPKLHVKTYHSQDGFRCNMRGGCPKPRFVLIARMLSHFLDDHPKELEKNSCPDLIRKEKITLPFSLLCLTCRLCGCQFLGGQSIEIVLCHQKWEHGLEESHERNIDFSCRVCGRGRSFQSYRDLKDHCRSHEPMSQQNSKSTQQVLPRDEVHSEKLREKASPMPSSSDLSAKECCYCFDRPMPQHHIKKVHLSQSFVCLLCPEADPPAFPDHGAVATHIDARHQRDKDDRSKYIKIPQDLRCMRCHLCSHDFHAVGIKEMKEGHFAMSHPDVSFDPGHLGKLTGSLEPFQFASFSSRLQVSHLHGGRRSR